MSLRVYQQLRHLSWQKQSTAAPVTEEGGGAKLLEEQTLFFHYYKMKARSWPSEEDDHCRGDELEQEHPASPEDSNVGLPMRMQGSLLINDCVPARIITTFSLRSKNVNGM